MIPTTVDKSLTNVVAEAESSTATRQSLADVAVIIVTWNVCALLRRCLQSLPVGGPGLKLQVIAVDNASSDDTALMIQQEFPHVDLIKNSENVGFSRGNNQGIAISRARYILILNPDTILWPDALTYLVRYMDEYPDVGAVGPQLVYPDGTVQSSRRRFPTWGSALMESTLLEQWFSGNRWARHLHYADRAADHTQDVDWLVGACILARAEAVAQVGGFDEGFFMYSEELDWCHRLRAAGWRVVYHPLALVYHFEGASSGQVLAQRDIYFHASKVRYWRKYHGRLAGETLRWFLLITFAYKWCVEAAKFVIGHRRTLRRERMAAYWQVLRSGFNVMRET